MAERVAHFNRDGSRASGLGRGAHGFWTKVVKRPDGCWVWTGYLDKDGAGKFCTTIDGKRTSVRAAVFAWRLLADEIPAGHQLLAVVCWNKRCVNPAHRMPIARGSMSGWLHGLGRPYEHADNRGELSGRALLREEDVLFIRLQARVLGAMPLLARLYRVSYQAILNAKYRRTWKHLGRRRERANERLSLKQLRELVETRERERAELDFERDRLAVSRGAA